MLILVQGKTNHAKIKPHYYHRYSASCYFTPPPLGGATFSVPFSQNIRKPIIKRLLMTFKNKLVAIINKEIEIGVAMNAVAHMVLGLGNSISAEELRLDTYSDKDGNQYPNISQIPFIILRGKSNEIKKAINAARESNVQYGVFTDTMTGGTYVEQIERTAQTKEEDLIFYGAVMFGNWDTVSTITKKFSLYR